MLWNPFMEKLTGIPASDIVGKFPTDVFPFLQDSGVIDNIKAAMKGEFTQTVEFPYNVPENRKSGWSLDTTSTLRNTKGEIIGAITTVSDVTQRKKAELEREQFYKLFTISSDIMVIADPNGAFKKVNPTTMEVLGYSENELIGKPFVDIVHIEDKQTTLDEMARQIITGSSLNFENRFICKDGNFLWLSWRANYNKEEGITYAVARDVTEEKRMLKELIKAKEKAEESDHLKSAFLTNMSHEIRTPMNGILGFAELLQEPNLSSDDQKRFIEIIGKSGERMLRTINNIVDISKIEAGLMSVYISKSNINKQIEFLYKFFTPMAKSKGLQLSYNLGLSSNEANIKTDDEKISSILTDLVNNAIVYTDEGSIEFGYKKNGEYLKFFVKDTGIGIPKDRLDAIFGHFIKADIEDKRAFQGSGLGLSISKSYVKMLGGRIWVESEKGLGSTFYFTIPYNAVSEEKIETISADSTENKEVQLKNLKILIVEDDEISYSLLSRMLPKISKEVLHATTGVEAVEACRNNPDLDLVLMDIRMPIMDGNEATRQIREFNKDVIIIAQTAYAFVGDSEKALEAGCNDYISKPINKTQLFGLIKKHVNR
jgi:PAS domain S-box-containing protein